MHLRINDVTVPPARIDELAEVLSNKALPVVRAQKGYAVMSFAADRGTGSCAIVSAWDSKEALDASEQAIASIRGETVDAVAGKLNSIQLAEVLREVRVSPSQVGSRARVVRLAAPGGSADELVELGFDEMTDSAITLVEWPERLPPREGPVLSIDLSLRPEFGEGSRFARISGTEGMRARLDRARAVRAALALLATTAHADAMVS